MIDVLFCRFFSVFSTLFRFCANQIAVEVVKNFKILLFEIINLKDKYVQNGFKYLLCLETAVEVAERKSEISSKKKGCLDKNRILMPSCV